MLFISIASIIHCSRVLLIDGFEVLLIVLIAEFGVHLLDNAHSLMDASLNRLTNQNKKSNPNYTNPISVPLNILTR